MYSISSLHQPTQVSLVSLKGPESGSELLCFTRALGRAGQSLHCRPCRPGEGAARCWPRVRRGERPCRAAPAPRHRVLWDKTSSCQVLFFCCSPRFGQFSGEGVCFLRIGLLACFFVCSLSQPRGQRVDGPTLCPCCPGQLAGSPPASWLGAEPFAFLLLGYCCFLLVNGYSFTYISAHLSLLIGRGERLKLRGGSLSWSLHSINRLKLRQWANKARFRWC